MLSELEMPDRAVIVLDTGKALAKLSLWASDGSLVQRRSRPNERIDAGNYAALDATGIENWLAETLHDFAGLADVGAIIPVSHGAAAAVVRAGALVCPPVDYEEAIPASARGEYDRIRDSFPQTGSPALPAGLNLGAQLFWLESLIPNLLSGDAVIMPWAQYWSWLLCGVPASEVSSLGCHTDLWRPTESLPSQLAIDRGWAAHFAPMRRAGEPLGPINLEWAARTRLPVDVMVHCGLHDSNAALFAARGFPKISEGEATVLSTGTWFVAMRSPARNANLEIASLDAARDCLVNVDIEGRPVPSARFMGGREIETLTGLDTRRIDIKPDQPNLLAAVGKVLAAGSMVVPTFVPNVGPFPKGRGHWINRPAGDAARRATVSLYAALVTDVALELIGARARLLIEGRFAEAEVFVRGLASLRPGLEVYISNAHTDVSYGALRLLFPGLPPPGELISVTPLAEDLNDYRRKWRRDADCGEKSA
jgi:sugar (pentulose or hexulose) kinase